MYLLLQYSEVKISLSISLFYCKTIHLLCKNCNYILNLKLLPYYCSRENSKLFIPPLYCVKNSILNWASNSILHVKSLFTCFYVIIDELSLDMHTLTDLSKLFLIYCMCFLWLYYQGVVHFTFSNLLLSISHGQSFFINYTSSFETRKFLLVSFANHQWTAR